MCFFGGRLENEKLRFDCAGASGSRLGPSRKAKKTQKKQPPNQHTYNTDFTPKIAHNISFRNR